MKVLDVGCHDGFVGYYLLQQWEPEQGELVIDGLELHPHGVKEAQRRGYHHVARGAAEEADQLFTPGSYDAVVAYELLEHVPDVQLLLSVLERMLTPTGMIYISTPDGTFGAGNNPHHLRAMRPVDLAELLRRRGDLASMGVGADGITVAAYRPQQRPLREAVIHTGGAWQRWSPLDIDTKGLGGSETAAVKLAEALSQQGWTVTVYGDVDQGVHGQVVYRHHETFDPMVPRDLFIASRTPELFDRPPAARTRLLWLHDTDCGERLTPERAEHMTGVLVLSGWHQMHVVSTYPFLDGKLAITRNGIDLARFREVPPTTGERARRLLYTSSPDRGLDILLELWPRIRKRAPGAVFEFAYAPVYQEIAKTDPTVRAHHQLITKLAKQKGVTGHLDGLSQPDLARLMLDSQVWAAPSFNTPHGVPFYETSCIGAMEAQAAGCVLVASAWGALPETISYGTLITTDPSGREWRQEFEDAIVEGLTNPTLQHTAQENGPRAAAELAWDGVAEQIGMLSQGVLIPA